MMKHVNTEYNLSHLEEDRVVRSGTISFPIKEIDV
jgi:hypothetical protein